MDASEIRHAFSGVVFRFFGSKNSAALAAKALAKTSKYPYSVKPVADTEGWLIVSCNKLEVLDRSGVLPLDMSKLLVDRGEYFELGEVS